MVVPISQAYPSHNFKFAAITEAEPVNGSIPLSHWPLDNKSSEALSGHVFEPHNAPNHRQPTCPSFSHIVREAS
jgi:hypothetical protein